MFSDALREMGILLIVFGLLDAAFGHQNVITQSPTKWIAFVSFCSAGLFLLGVIIERNR